MFRAFLNTLGNVVLLNNRNESIEDHFDIEGVLTSNTPFLNQSGAKSASLICVLSPASGQKQPLKLSLHLRGSERNDGRHCSALKPGRFLSALRALSE
jgi:hypothetical protein